MTVRCSSCDKPIFGTQHRTVRFSSLTHCSSCLHEFFGWLYDEGVLDGNPLVAELWYAVLTIPIRSPKYGLIASAKVDGFKLKVEK